MLASLLTEIEKDHLTSAFYLASSPDWLYRQIVQLPAVEALLDLVMDDPADAATLAWRTIELFDAPTEPGYRSDHETALCCYAYVLSQLPGDAARWAVDHLDANAGPAHGWLDLLMPRFLRNASTTDYVEEHPGHATFLLVNVSTPTPATATGAPSMSLNNTSFDALDEVWSAEVVHPLDWVR